MLNHLASAPVVDLAAAGTSRRRVTAAETAGRDLDAATAAAAAMLSALGVDVSAESLRDTPLRMARAYEEMLSPPEFDLTVFPNSEAYQQLVLTRDIAFRSLCEHHFLPFVGVAHVGYLPGDRLVGLSKLARVVTMFARRPQTQERMTEQIAGWLHDQLDARGVGVVVRAEHLCMTMRGAQSPGATTLTSAWRGLLLDEPSRREEFHTAVR
ncbi:GTP cyclohydrolase I FolE [Nocardia amamiensis]|uniref:GTP cyclohydrolase I FolE n=1 Tax=Nocardia amamiensis TaxID=404578 RepID=UPI00082FA17B|nr:GTP cyclohydrolase I FolE [Nocardia amamiensis]